MSLLQAVFLGIVQGITEFLPISSSGHLVLVQTLFGLNDLVALKSFDIAVHFGTLLAILIYFSKDYLDLIKAFWMTLTRKKCQSNEQAKWLKEKQKLMAILIIGTIPAVLVGLFLGDILDHYFLNAISIPIMLIVVGVIFLWAEKFYGNLQHKEAISWKEGLFIGCAQALALIPGVSRSGATISTGLFLGIEREKAARFSFLLGSVAMIAATAFAVYKVSKGEYSLPETDILLAGIITSFLSGLWAISFLLSYLRKHTLAVFAYYRFAVAITFSIWFLWMIGELGRTLQSF